MIRWSTPSYSTDRITASVGTVAIGYIVPPVRGAGHWEWFLTFKRGADAEGRATGEHYARIAVARRWHDWAAAAGLIYDQRGTA